jgi:SAM-dependent methyltransferase
MHTPMTASKEIESGDRFGFGANWAHFLSVLDDERIEAAEASLKEMLGVTSLAGLRFLDIGSGSGLLSLAARRLGAQVHSFDYDSESVACTRELKRRYFAGDDAWRIEEGSVLDRRYMSGLGQFDVVYSWGVLHHTGAMWLAIEHAISCVAADRGKFFLAIYNDQGWKSHAWWFTKLFYNKLPRLLKSPFVALYSFVVTCLVVLKHLLRLKPMTALARLRGDRKERGMSVKYDKADWLGGFPFEFVRFEILTAYMEARGFSLLSSQRNNNLGCHELVLQRTAATR